MKLFNDIRQLMVLTFIGLGCCTTVHAQQAKKAVPQELKIIARAYKDSVRLRWAPTTVMLWKAANESGYTIRRFTIVRKGKVLRVPEQVVLTPRPLKPLPLKDWEKVAQQEERYGSIAAQALYGESFEVSTDNKQGASQITQIYHRSQELESRYSFTLFAADQSYLVAGAAGLAFTDRNALPDEKYLYQVMLADNPYKVKADTGSVFTGFSDALPIPVPRDLRAEPLPHAVLLSWNKTLFENVFTAYIAERSDDGGRTFHAVSETPLVNTQVGRDKDNSQRFFRVDSVPTGKRIIYRLKGITPFSEISEASDTAAIVVNERLEARPAITSAAIQENGQVQLHWMMPAGNATITGFEVERAVAVNKQYTVISRELLKADAIQFTDISPRPVNYYRIKVNTPDGQSAYSLPYLVQLEDSIPPSAPVGLKGVADKNGIVRLVWDANKENDIYAYRVFRSNDTLSEFVQVSRAPVTATLFTDTITLKTLTKNVYYRVVALDNHYNPSGFSAVLPLKRPDIVPPVPPVLINASAGTEGIVLQWQPSTSADVAKHEVLRAVDTVWTVLKSILPGDTTAAFTDTSAVPGVHYHYAIVAEDDSQLRTVSKAVSMTRIDLGLPAGGRNILTAGIDRENKSIVLKWKPVKDLQQVWVYRAVAGQPFRLYKTLRPEDKTFTDTELFINTDYKYKLKVIKTSGSGFLTDEIIVHY